ncbi:MAG: hypothetical protein ACFUZC_17300 [Chthoniobacteraceae bacterium]
MKRASGFSLVEVSLALGVVAVALIAILGLLPFGIQTNKVTIDETRAASDILTSLEADLRNTYPSATFNASPNAFGAGRSRIFGLALPYSMSGTPSRVALNTALSAVTSGTVPVPGEWSTALDDSLHPLPTFSQHAPFQATVVYTTVPSSGLTPIQAKLIVSWPALSNATVADLTDTAKVRGYVQAVVTFPEP